MSFDESFQTVFDSIENPQKLWHSDSLEDRRLVLKLVFTRPLAYHRKEGFQTAAIALPFGLSGQLINDNSVLVVGNGLSSNFSDSFLEEFQACNDLFEHPSISMGKQYVWEPLMVKAGFKECIGINVCNNCHGSRCSIITL